MGLMKKMVPLAGVGFVAAGIMLTVSCGKSGEEAPARSVVTTHPFVMATRPAADPYATATDFSCATQPEDATSVPVGQPKPVTLPKGLIVTDLRIGKGPTVLPTDHVFVRYVGWLDNGTIFDDGRARGTGTLFLLGKDQVISGWEEGLPGMKAGGVRLLTVPPELGYGNESKPNIPPGSTLHFRIELERVDLQMR